MKPALSPALIPLVFLCGCASHTVQYSLGPSPARTSACQSIRVAVAPVPREQAPYQCGSAAYGAVRLNREALSKLLSQHLTQQRVFTATETTDREASKHTTKDYAALKARGVDVLLVPRVLQIQGGRSMGVTDGVGTALGSAALLAASPLEKTFYTATATVEFKLIATADGSTLWYGTSIGTAQGTEGLNKTVDASLQAAFENLINDLCAAELDRRRLQAK